MFSLMVSKSYVTCYSKQPGSKQANQAVDNRSGSCVIARSGWQLREPAETAKLQSDCVS